MFSLTIFIICFCRYNDACIKYIKFFGIYPNIGKSKKNKNGKKVKGEIGKRVKLRIIKKLQPNKYGCSFCYYIYVFR